ncbi:MAG TPA: RIP metalloprotease RseP [Alphaproteobacteria bacterium]|nr:RIP metalloprotease RseP [Alphaproteobacteria bacterium]
MNNDNLPPDFLAHIAQLAKTLPGGETLFSVVAFIVVLGILVFVHEWGHYFAARSVGIRVQAFAIGFGRPIIQWVDKQKTHWQIGWLPLGGYVQMLGQEDGKAYSHKNHKDSFAAKAIWQRAWVVVAGPLMNLVFAFVLVLGLMLSGERQLRPEVGGTLPNMPAHGLLQKGDIVRQADDTQIITWDDFQTYVSEHAGVPVQLVVERNGLPKHINITPQKSEFKDLLGDNHIVGRVGVSPSYAAFVQHHGVGGSLRRAVEHTWELTSMTVNAFGKLLVGAIAPENLTGPLGIADMAGQTAANGLYAVATLMAIISINLMVINLFPLPVLDGGHLLFLLYERIRGRPLPEKVQMVALRVGLTLIIMLAVFATFNDVKRFGWVQKAYNAVTGQAGSAAMAATPAGTPPQ